MKILGWKGNISNKLGDWFDMTGVFWHRRSIICWLHGIFTKFTVFTNRTEWISKYLVTMTVGITVRKLCGLGDVLRLCWLWRFVFTGAGRGGHFDMLQVHFLQLAQHVVWVRIVVRWQLQHGPGLEHDTCIGTRDRGREFLIFHTQMRNSKLTSFANSSNLALFSSICLARQAGRVA